MSVYSIILATLATIWVISQFGKLIPPRDAIIWWVLGLFIYSAILVPEMYSPIAKLLGFQLASNFILSSSLLIFVVYILKLTVQVDLIKESQRNIISDLAANEYLRKNNDLYAENESRLKVLIVVPCFNEEDSISNVIRELQGLKSEQFIIKICAINDCSSDRTKPILESTFDEMHTSHITNIGVSGVMLTGFKIAKRAQCDFVVQFDGDGQHPAEKIMRLLETAKSSSASLVIGSRFLTNDLDRSSTSARRVGIVLLSQVLRLIGNSQVIADPTSGFRVYSRDAMDFLIRRIPEQYPEPESIALLSLAGKQIVEVEAKMKPRTTGISSLAGIKSITFMVKVLSSLIGLLIRDKIPSR